MKQLLIALFLLITPAAAQAAADLAITNTDIRFSEEELIAGDTVRVYATVRNVGDEDVAGYITFYQGSVLIGDSQVISVVAEGNPEEVYADFVVPSSRFNIQAIIRGTDPQDSNTSNDVAITSYYEPVLDDDRDGVSNDSDNCPSIGNADQTDTDGDGLGDLCDSDDDGDGLSDEVESEIGSSPTSSDTDGDGVDDPDDAYPTDPDKTEIEPDPEPEPEPVLVEEFVEEVAEEERDEEAGILADIISDLADDVAAELLGDIDGEVEETDDEEVIPSAGELIVSPGALFSYEQLDWNTFSFHTLGPSATSVSYAWDFGDDVTSSREDVEHTFEGTGEFLVKLTISDAAGVISEEEVRIFVPFFSLENTVILITVALLFLLLLVGLAVVVSMVFQERRRVEQQVALNNTGKKRKRAKKISVTEDDD